MSTMSKPTREQILAEPAGTTLDGWVAEYVMGWPVYTLEQELHDGNTPRPHCVRCFDVAGKNALHVFRADSSGGWWCPSETIAAAWEVVQVMQGMLPLGLVSILSGDDGIWRAAFGWVPGRVSGMKYADAETPMLAICRAALLLKIEGAR